MVKTNLAEAGSLHFVDSVGQMKDLGVQLLHEALELCYGIQHFYSTGVRVEPDFERSGHGADPSSEFVFHVIEAFGYVVDGLVFLILVGLDSGGSRVEWSVFWFFRKGVEEFTVGGQKSGAVNFGFSGFFAKAEFNSEPIDLKKKLYINHIVKNNLQRITITQVNVVMIKV